MPAAVRFLSIEPMLGEIELTGHEYSVAPGLDEGIDWLTGKTSQASNIFGGDAAPWRSRDCYDFPQDAEEPRIHWVISGGESGPHARPMHPDWARSLRDQCAAAGVPFMFKQWGEFGPSPDDWRLSNGGVAFPEGSIFAGMPSRQIHRNFDDYATSSDTTAEQMRHIGKKAAGRVLDGRTHDAFPKGGA